MGEYLTADRDNALAGGVFNSRNLQTYHYGGNNPIKYKDPSGKFAIPLLPILGLAVIAIAIVVIASPLIDTTPPPSFGGPLTYPGTQPPSFDGPLINVPAPPSSTSTANPDAPPAQSPFAHEPSLPAEPSPIATTSDSFTDLPHDRKPTSHTPDAINNATGEYIRVDPGTHNDKKTKTLAGAKTGYHTHTWGPPSTHPDLTEEEREKQRARGYGNSTGTRESTPEEIEYYKQRYENGGQNNNGGQTSPES